MQHVEAPATAFQWIRRRRILNDISKNDVAGFEFHNIKCRCKGNPDAISVPVLEIVLAEDLTCVLFDGGIGKALDRSTHEELCTLNASELCVIRSICYNTWNGTVVTVWHSRVMNQGLCISVLDRDRIRKGDPTPTRIAQKIQNLIIPYPGFVEFEESNGCIVTSTAYDQQFQFWDMKTYERVFEMNNFEYKEIRISKGTVAFFRQPRDNILPVKLCNIMDGESLAEQELLLHPNRELRFLELCGCYLLVKQDGACIRIHDLVDGAVRRVSGTKEFLPKAVTFFTDEIGGSAIKPSKGPTSFLAVHEDKLEVCTCYEGKLVSLASVGTKTSKSPADCLQVVQNRQLLLVYTKDVDAFFGSEVNPTVATERQEVQFIETPRKPKFKNAKINSKSSAYSQIPIFDDCIEPTFLGPSKSALMALNRRKGGPGISVIDLVTGSRLAFIPVSCDDAISVLLYDPLRREILAGGARGLHRIGHSFQKMDDEDETNTTIELDEKGLFAKLQLPFRSLRQALLRQHGVQPTFSHDEISSRVFREFLCSASIRGDRYVKKRRQPVRTCRFKTTAGTTVNNRAETHHNARSRKKTRD